MVYYLICMKKIVNVIIIFAVVIFAGCLDNSGSGSATAGVMKSEDGGKTFLPFNVITEKKSLAGSSVLSIEIDPMDSAVVYAGTEKDDLFVSRDGAISWTVIPTGLVNIGDIAINPFNPQIIYISGMYNGRGSVLRSRDGGENWERVYVEPKDGTSISAMVISPVNANIVYIGTSGGTIARTVNGGDVWENLFHAESSVGTLLIDKGNVNTLYALIDGRDIVRSRDEGATFESIASLQRDSITQKLYQGALYSLTASPVVSGTIVVGTNQGVFRSVDYGLSWTPVDVIASSIGINIYAIEISPHDANQLVFVAAKAVYTSVSNGWAITDTTSNRVVDVITHDPRNANVIYIGLKKVN